MMLKRLANTLFAAWCGMGIFFLISGATSGKLRDFAICIGICGACILAGWVMKYILVGNGDNTSPL